MARPLSEQLQRWYEAGLIDQRTAAAIRSWKAERPAALTAARGQGRPQPLQLR